MGCATYVPGPACSGTDSVEGIFHSTYNDGALTHAQIVITAPHDNFLGAVFHIPRGQRKFTAPPGNIDENPVPAFRLKLVYCITKDALIVHARHLATAIFRPQESV
jgi:hypothetical protein